MGVGGGPARVPLRRTQSHGTEGGFAAPTWGSRVPAGPAGQEDRGATGLSFAGARAVRVQRPGRGRKKALPAPGKGARPLGAPGPARDARALTATAAGLSEKLS